MLWNSKFNSNGMFQWWNGAISYSEHFWHSNAFLWNYKTLAQNPFTCHLLLIRVCASELPITSRWSICTKMFLWERERVICRVCLCLSVCVCVCAFDSTEGVHMSGDKRYFTLFNFQQTHIDAHSELFCRPNICEPNFIRHIVCHIHANGITVGANAVLRSLLCIVDISLCGDAIKKLC